MKNNNIHIFFAVLVANLNLPALLQNKNTPLGPFPWKRSVLQNPDRERTNQSSQICLRLVLPCNKLLTIIPRAQMGSESTAAEWAVELQAMSARGIIVLVKSNYMVKNIETKQL